MLSVCQLGYFGGNEVRFLVVVVTEHGLGQESLGARAPELFAGTIRVMDNDVVGDIQDGLMGAVVLLQLDDDGPREVFLEIEDIADVGATKGVDTLVVVTDHSQIVMFFGKNLEHHVLGVVSILILVYE